MNIRKINVLLFLSLYASCIFGQTPCRGCDSISTKVSLKDMYWTKMDGNVLVNFTLDASRLDLKSNESVLIVPYMHSKEGETSLPGIMLCGRKQYQMLRRGKEKQLKKDGITLLWYKKQNRKKKEVEFFYQDMLKAEGLLPEEGVWLSEFYGGCGNSLYLLDQLAVLSKPELEIFEVTPHCVYVMPQVESIKARMESGKAYLDFPVNRTDIREDYHSNQEELDKIKKTIDYLVKNKDVRLSGIKIHGFASPEGSFKTNERLAKGRSQSLKDYVKGLYSFEDSLCTVAWTPEDWEGMMAYAREKEQAGSGLLLSFLQETSGLDPDIREKRMRKAVGQDEYAFISKNIYPVLRHSDYEVSYVVKGFEPEEGKKYLKTRPSMLSLQEMFLIANTYPTGSEEFKEVFDIAVHLYPDDAVANLNAANIALEERNTHRAKKYLDKAGDSPEVSYARGWYHLLRDEFDEAEKFLHEAKEKGITQADETLQQLEKRKRVVK